jgi:hypothetical protein
MSNSAGDPVCKLRIVRSRKHPFIQLSLVSRNAVVLTPSLLVLPSAVLLLSKLSVVQQPNEGHGNSKDE